MRFAATHRVLKRYRTAGVRLLIVAAAVVLAVAALFSFRTNGKSSAEEFNARIHAIEGGSFEASGVVHVAGTDGVLFIDDARPNAILWMELSPEGVQKAPAVSVPLGGSVMDPEGITTDGSRFYVVGSQSKKGDGRTAGLARFRFEAGQRRIEQLEVFEGLNAFLAEHVRGLEKARDEFSEDVLNIEGLAWDPRGNRLLLGLKAPVTEQTALIVPLSLRNRSAPLSGENLQVDGSPIQLPSGGGGIRSLEYDPGANAFRVVVDARSGTSRWRLLEWQEPGRSEPVRELMTFPGRLKPEGVAPIEVKGRRATIVVFDTGQYAVLD